MQGSAKIKGLDNALAAMRAAFPSNPEQQRRLLNQALSGSARKTIIPIAKQLALQGDGSGALSEAIAPRAISRGRTLARGMTASVQVTPVRGNRKAIALYINHYYANRGKAAPSSIVTDGIRHGHLIEFGTKNTSARPFLYPALQSGVGAFTQAFSGFLKKKIEAAVRRRARR